MTSEHDIREKLKEVKDPEIGLDVVTLGLVREIRVLEDGAEIVMTLTSPFCPFADKIITEVEALASELLPEGQTARVEITFSPPWEPPEELREMMGA